jgi:hypothetical protein
MQNVDRSANPETGGQSQMMLPHLALMRIELCTGRGEQKMRRMTMMKTKKGTMMMNRQTNRVIQLTKRLVAEEIGLSLRLRPQNHRCLVALESFENGNNAVCTIETKLKQEVPQLSGNR